MTAPVDVLAWIDLATTGLHCLSQGSPAALNGSEVHDAVAELIEAGRRADGDKRPKRPERGLCYGDAEWEVFLRGWDAHAEAVYYSGLRAALARVGAK